MSGLIRRRERPAPWLLRLSGVRADAREVGQAAWRHGKGDVASPAATLSFEKPPLKCGASTIWR